MRLSDGLVIWGALNWEVTVSADLLGAGLLLGLEGGEFNKQGTAGSDNQAGAALPGRGVHLPGTTGAMGGDCIRGCTSVRPLSPTAPAVAAPSLGVGHPCPAFPPSQFLSVPAQV